MTAAVGTVSAGRIMEMVNRVDGNDPATARFTIVLLVSGHEAIGTLRDYDDLAALLVPAGNVEGTATNYARVHREDTDIGAYTVDKPNNRIDWTLADITPALSAVAAGDTYSVGVICYDPLGTGVDANMEIVHVEEFTSDLVTNGSDINFDFPAVLLRSTAS